MSESLGELLLEIGLSPDKALKDLEAFKKDALGHAKDIENSLKLNLNLKPIVDESHLTSLNKHLDLKQSHFKQVQNYFNSNPLTVKTDTTQLDKLEARLKGLDSKVHNVKVNVQQTITNAGRVRVDPKTQPATKVEFDSSNFSKMGDAIAKASEKHFDNLSKEISKSSKGSPIGAVFKAVAAPFQAVGRGALEGVGREATRELSRGISDGIARELSHVIGSFELVGKELGKELISGILDSLGKDAQKIEQIFEDVLGKPNVARAGAAVRGRQSIKGAEDSTIAREQVGREYGFVKDNMSAIKNFGGAVQQQQDELKAKAEALQNQIFELESKLGLTDLTKSLESKIRDLQVVNREIAVAAKKGDTEKLSVLKAQANTINADIESYSLAIDRVRDTVSNTFQGALQDIRLAEDDLAVQERKLKRFSSAVENYALLDVPKNMVSSNKTVASASNNKSKQARQISRFYKDVVDEVGAASGIDIASGDIPRLVAANLPKGTNAAYLRDSNTVQVAPEVLEAINQGTVTNKQLETLVHELRHAVQADFGRVKGQDIAVSALKPNNEEAKRLGALIEKSTRGGRGGDSAYRREIEADAYVFADRQTPAIQQRLAKTQALRGLDEVVGIGGGNLQEDLKVTQLKALKLMSGIKSDSPVDMTSATQEVLTKFDTINNDFIKTLDLLSNVEDLPVEDIKAIQDALINSLAEAKKAVLMEVKNFQNIANQEKEAVLVENRPKENVNTRQMELGRPSNIPTAASKDVSTVRANAELIASAVGPQDALDRADKIAKAFWASNKAIKDAIKEGDVTKAENLLAYTRELGNKATLEIKELTDGLGEDAKFGSQLGSQLANRKGQIAKALKQVEQLQANLAKSVKDGSENVNLSTDSIETLLNEARQALVDGTIEDVDAFFNSIKIDELTIQEGEGLDDDVAYAMEDIKKIFEQYIANLTNGISVDEAEVRAAYADASFKGHADKFENAENNINNRAAKAEDAVARNLANEGAGTETLLSRINRILKSEGILGGEGLLKGIKEQALGLLKGFLGYTSLAFIGPMFMKFADAAFHAAAEMQRFRFILKFVEGDAQTAASSIESIRQQADNLGGAYKSGLQGYIQMAASARETALEGDATRAIFDAVQQASAVYELDEQQTDRVMLAIQQMISKGTVQSQELRQQLGDSLPGAFQLAARAQGVSTEEFSRMMERGQVSAVEFLPKFAQQLSAETAGGVEDAANSAFAAMNRLNNAIFIMEAAFGELILPMRQLGLNVMADAMIMVSEYAQILASGISALALGMAAKLIPAAVKAAISLGILPTTFKAAGMAALSTAKAFGVFALKTLALQAVLMAAAAIAQLFQDASGEMGEVANSSSQKLENLKTALDGISESGKEAANSLKDVKVGGAIGALDFLRSDNKKQVGLVPDLNPVSLFVNAVSNRQASNQQRDTLKEADRSADNVNQVLAISDEFLRGEGRAKLEEFKQIDAQIESMQQKLRALKALDPDDVEAQSKLETEINDKLESRKDLMQGIAQARQGVDDQLSEMQGAVDALERMRDDRVITRETYETAIGKILPQIAKLEKEQSNWNDELDKSVTALDRIARALRDVGSSFQDSMSASQNAEARGRSAIARARLSGASEGQVQNLQTQLERNTLQVQLVAAQKAISDIQSLLNTPELAAAIDAMGGSAKLNSLGPNALADMSEDLGDTSPEMQKALEGMIQVKEYESQVLGIQASIDEASANARDRLIELGKSITDYYKGIQESFESTMRDVESTLAQANFDNLKAGLTNAISGITDNFLGAYFDVITNTLETIFESIMDTINTSRQIADINAQLQGVINQGNDLFNSTGAGSIGDLSSDAVSSVVREANSWDGREFNAGIRYQCAFFVNEVFKRSGIELGNRGSGLAASFFDGNTGSVQWTNNPNAIPAGAIVGFENTYDGPGAGVGGYTHVGVSTGGGRMVDRSTSARPVSERAITTFRPDSRGGYSYVVPNSLIQSSGALNQSNQTAVQPQAATANLTVKGRQATQEQIQLARTIAETGRRLGASQRDIEGAIATAIQESTLRNLTGGDRDSLGIFQQRPSMEWGSRSQIANPEFAAESFFKGRGSNVGLLSVNDRSDIYRASHRVQRSAHPDAPRQWDSEARALAAAVMGGGSGVPQPGVDTSGITQGQSLALQGANAEIDGVQQSLAARDALRTAQINLNTRKAEQQALQDARRNEDAERTRNRQLEDRRLAVAPQTAESQLEQNLIKLQRDFEDSNRELLREMEDMQLSSENADAQIAAFNTAIDALVQQGANPEQIQAIRTQIGILEQAQATLQPELDSRRKHLAESEELHNKELEQLKLAGEIAIEAERISKIRSRLTFDKQTTEPLIELMRREGKQSQANQMQFNIEIDEIELEKLETLNSLRKELADGLIDQEEYDLRVNVIETYTENRLRLQRQNAARTTNDQSLRDERAVFDSNSAVMDARMQRADTLGFSNAYAVQQVKLQQALNAENLRFREQLQQIQNDATLSAESIAKMTENAELLNNLNLSNLQLQFSELPELIAPVQAGMKGFFSDILSNSKTVGEAFRDMVNSIISGLAQIVAEKLVSGMTDGLFGGLFGGEESPDITGSNPGETLANGANASAQMFIDAGYEFANVIQNAAISFEASVNMASRGGMFGGLESGDFGSGAFSFLGGGNRSGRGGLKVDTDNLNLSFASGARSLGDAIVKGSETGGGLFQNLLGGLFSGSGSSGGGGILGSLLGGLGGGGGLGGIFSLVSGILGFEKGGYINSYVTGGMVGATDLQTALQREGRGAQVIVANDREAVINERQMKVINGALALQGMDLRDVFAGNYQSGGFIGSPASSGVNLSQNNNQNRQGANITIPINIESSGNRDNDAMLTATLRDRIYAVTLDTLAEQKKSGGMLSDF